MRCYALLRTDIGFLTAPALASTAFSPPGYHPASLRAAYKLSTSTTGGSGQKVAIVDAFNDPNAEKDMNSYRSFFGLGPCTTASGCFKKVNQNGGTTYPANDVNAGIEISLDLDMVSAICPKCHIILVEANDLHVVNLGTAVNRAVTLGANVVSNSYGGSEFAASYSPYNHPGHVIVAAAGDTGTGAEQPCSFSTVVCVGGTTLKAAANTRGWSETVWNGTGSGCSALVLKPSWQTDTGCKKRSEADVAAVADPNTGVSVYDSFGVCCWGEVGGTSASTPIVSGVYALAGNASTMTAAKSLWQHIDTSSVFDVLSGSNGSCAITYICHAEEDYDGPTGAGTPDGTSAF
jgi:subtilase family serine protease